MEKGHLTYEELERYAEDTDFSEEYMMFCEPLMAHLDTCELCRERLDKMLLLSTMTKEADMALALNLVRQETQIRRKIVALRLGMMAKDRRMAEIAGRLEQGLLKQISVAKADFIKVQAAVRSSDSEEQKPVTVHYEEGKASVTVRCKKQADVTVILVPVKEKDAKIMVATAKWDEKKGLAQATFEIAQLEECYEIYVDEKEDIELGDVLETP
ncbi:MAG: hypothetical protein IJ282_06195 [Lachnospiraceae bacterium]|nr:hypothetical protein [Lachnospiraceae bacterium]